MDQSIFKVSFSKPEIPSLRTEPDRRDWVRYGPDNLYPQRLIDLRSLSTTHNSILQLKTDLLVGEGWQQETGIPWLNTGFLRKIAADLVCFNGFALQILQKGTGETEIRPLPFQSLRVAKPKPGHKPDSYFYCKAWEWFERGGSPFAKPVKVTGYQKGSKPEAGRQIFYFHLPAIENEFYPAASYHAAFSDILFENEISRFKLQNIRNGMFPVLHIEIEGLPEEQEREKFQKDLARKFQGADNAGQVLVTYGLEGEGKTRIQPIEIMGNSELFAQWSDAARQSIITAHRLTSPVLAGLPGSSTLGSSAGEIAVAYEHFHASVIRPMQRMILENLSELFNDLDIKPAHKLEIANVKPVRLVFSEALLAQVLTQDELRAELGYPPLQPELERKGGKAS